MGSLTNTGQHVSQDTYSTKHVGHSIRVTDYSDDSTYNTYDLEVS